MQSRAGYKDQLRFERSQYSLFWEADWSLGKSTLGIHHIDSKNEGRTLPPTLGEREYIKAQGWTVNDLATAMQDPVFLAMLPRPDRPLESTNTTYSAKYEVPLDNHFVVAGAEYQDSRLKDGVFGMEGGSQAKVKILPVCTLCRG